MTGFSGRKPPRIPLGTPGEWEIQDSRDVLRKVGWFEDRDITHSFEVRIVAGQEGEAVLTHIVLLLRPSRAKRLRARDGAWVGSAVNPTTADGAVYGKSTARVRPERALNQPKPGKRVWSRCPDLDWIWSLTSST